LAGAGGRLDEDDWDGAVGGLADAGAEIGVDEDDEFFAHGVELVLGGFGFEQAAGEAVESGDDGVRDDFGVLGEGFAGGGEELDDGVAGSLAGGLGDGGTVDVGADGVEGGAGFDVLHLGGEVGEDEGGAHVEQAGGGLLGADGFDGGTDLVHVAAEGGLKKGALVGKVLIEGSDGDSGAGGDPCGGEALFADGGENLKGGLQDGLDGGVGTCLDGRFAGL